MERIPQGKKKKYSSPTLTRLTPEEAIQILRRKSPTNAQAPDSLQLFRRQDDKQKPVPNDCN
jgi:hypothetical protein